MLKKVSFFMTALMLLAVACSSEAGNEAQAVSSLDPGSVYQIQDLTDKPSIEKFAELKYPESLKESGKEGTTILSIIVDVDGSVAEAEVEKTSGEDAFDEAAIASARQFQFKPGEVDGKLVKSRVLLPIRFKVQ